MKKAQVETIGLVVIVALIAFILIFVLQIIVKPGVNELNVRYMQINADNLRSSILKTNACSGITIRDELVSCNEFFLTRCQNLDCNKLENVITKIIESSLSKKSYKFTAGNILLEKDFNSCKEVYTAAKEPIPYSNVEINLAIC